MKKLLLLAFLIVSFYRVEAASPSTNIPISLLPLLTNSLNSTSVFPIVQGGVTYKATLNQLRLAFALYDLWSLSGGTLYPTFSQTNLSATNVFSKQSLHTDGALFTTPSSFTVNVGSNNVNVAPYSFIRITANANTTNASDRIISLNANTNQIGQLLTIENLASPTITNTAFTLPSGSSLYSGSGSVILVYGNWAPTRSGETILLQYDGQDWREVTRFVGSSGGPSIIPQPFMAIMNLGGSNPATDGSITNMAILDADYDYIWYNKGSIAVPAWIQH